MTEFNPLGWWRRLMALPNDSKLKTLAVVFLVATACAALVSISTVLLRPLQEANLAKDREQRMAQMIAAMPGMAAIMERSGADRLDMVIVDLVRARIDRSIEASSFDYRASLANPRTGTALTRDADIAGIGFRPDRVPVWLLQDEDALALLVLPVYGAGYQSTIHAYLALESDLNTVAALIVYEQAETAGIGSRIANAAWAARWVGRKVADEQGNVVISVVRGRSGSDYEVDGISGATNSTTGITNLVQFWMGPLGFGPFLERLKAGEI
jgi:Na+-transporting NADH:ubiquinone oxidoreductase subunit C